MKRLWSIPVLLLFLLTGCARSGGPEAAAPAPPAAAAEPATDVVYVDVRTAEEYAASHVEGALHIPYDEMETRWEELLPYKDQRIVLYCRSGRRSGIALDVVQAKGLTNVENGGALSALVEAGVPTASS